MRYAVPVLAVAAAVNALPQGVTKTISPSAPMPSGCSANYPSTFAIAVLPISKHAKRQLSTSTSTVTILTTSTIQPLSTSTSTHTILTTSTVSPSTSTETLTTTLYTTITSTPTVTVQTSTAASVVASVVPVSEIGDGQPQAPVSTPTPASYIVPVSQISDGQIQGPTVSAVAKPLPTTIRHLLARDAQVLSDEDVTVQEINNKTVLFTCASHKPLVVSLRNGQTFDAQARVGYIASNGQFQFDGPPQAGAIYTSGFSTCNDGTMAFGGSNVFYRCLSGSFYNLYDRSIGGQCEPVNVHLVEINRDC